MSGFRVLGAVEAWAGDRPLPLGGPRQVKLLACLLVHANRAVSADVLIDAVWGPERDGALKRLQMAVARLRKTLEPLAGDDRVMLRTVSGGYLLSIAAGRLDADVFAERVRDGRRALEEGEAAQASELLAEALGLWRGPPLAEVAYEDFAQAEIRRLEELRVTALETRIDADLQLGRHSELVSELEALLDQQPTRERLAGQLMTALYRSGRQADALEVYQRTRARLAEALGLEPGPALRVLQSQILEHAPALSVPEPASRTAEAAAANGRASYQEHRAEERVAIVPRPPTPTIGRERDLERVSRLFEDPDVRLVTLTGPGGVGKTRLASVVARAIGSSFPDGVGWIELAGVTRPEDVASTVLRALAVTSLPGESTSDALGRHLAAKRLLLVIDNFEQVLEAADLVGELLATCPGVAFLATSREPLHLAAERRVPVTPLAVPAFSEAISVAEVEAADASALFLAAARRRDSEFAISPGSAPEIARICAALDGLPLALELAAARTGLLSVQELAERLDRAATDVGGAPRDAPARHHTLQATIDWSYRLLDAEQQSVFVRFAVFAGGATLEAAQAVTDARLETLEALVAKSLLDRRRQPDGLTRLIMLETVRASALERLADHPDRSAAYRRHFEHYREVVERVTRRLSTPDETQALTVIDSEVDNLNAALQWALDAAPNSALRLAGHLGRYWKIRADPRGVYWLEAALEAAGSDAAAQDRARALLELSYELGMDQRRTEANKAAEEALALFRESRDQTGIAQACIACAMDAYNFGDTEGARAYLEEARRLPRLADDDALHGKVLARLALALPSDQRAPLLDKAGQLLTQVGDYGELAGAYLSAGYTCLVEDRVAEALGFLDLALSAVAKVNSPSAEMLLWGNLGLAKLFSGELVEARAAFERQLRLCVGKAFRFGADEGLAGLAAVSAAEGKRQQAAQLLGAARAMGYPQPLDQAIDDRLEREYFRPAQTTCGTDTWRKAEETGAKLSYEKAIELALGQSPPNARHRTVMSNETDSRLDGIPATVVRLRSSETPKLQPHRRRRTN